MQVFKTGIYPSPANIAELLKRLGKSSYEMVLCCCRFGMSIKLAMFKRSIIKYAIAVNLFFNL